MRAGLEGARVSPDGSIDESSLPAELRAMIAAARRPEYLGANGRLIGRPFVSKVFKGERFVAIGGRITKIPPGATFHEFLQALLVDEVLSRAWVAAEQEKGESGHPIVRWLSDIRALRAAAPAPVGKVHSVGATGSALAFLTLAYDVYSTYHCARLPARIRSRLKHPLEFQGAKYEIAVAGLFVRAGFTIEWINNSTRRRPEFVARHKTTGEQLVVEAKSRRRAGVLGHPGAQRADSPTADLDGLFRDALEKETDGLPYVICLDANLPLGTNGQAGATWLRDIQRMLEERASSPTEPEPFAAITVTNFSWHYAGASTVGGQSESLLVLPRFPAVALRDPRTTQLIFSAMQQYGDVPGVFPDD